tara:strand:- start:86 stop:274 length:189 start_codon:yes stop_codon:yes gene_type:complete
MERIVNAEAVATEMWQFVHSLNLGCYEDRDMPEEQLMAMHEIVEAAEEIIDNKNYIIKDIIK